MADASQRILYLNRVSLLGGAERILLRSMEVAASVGYTPLLACPDGGGLPEAARERGFRVVPCEFNRLKGTPRPDALLRYAWDLQRENRRVRRICRQEGVRLIHAHSPVSALYGLSAARSLGIKMLVHVHDALQPNAQYRLVTRIVEPSTERFVCVSQAALNMTRAMQVPESKTQVIYNALDPTFMAARAKPCPEVCGPGPHIGAFALILPLKGQHVFLNAAAQLAERLPTAHFYVVGEIPYPDQQPYLSQLRDIARTPALRGRVSFPGFQTNVVDWMAAMDVVVLPSVEPESFGNVLLEGMSLGRRVIGTNIGGALEIVRDGETGRLVPPGDAAALAAAMEDLATRPPDDPMGRRAAEDVRTRFSPERFGEEIAALYREMLDGTPDGRVAGR